MPETTRRNTPQGIERRRHRRFLPRECDLSLMRDATGLVKLFGGGKKVNIAHAVLDLSEGGARFVTRTKLTVGTKVHVTISVRLFNDSIQTQGAVCWCSEHSVKAGHFYVGVNFEKVDPVQARKIAGIREYISSPEFRLKEETRRRTRPSYDTDLLEYDI